MELDFRLVGNGRDIPIHVDGRVLHDLNWNFFRLVGRGNHLRTFCLHFGEKSLLLFQDDRRGGLALQTHRALTSLKQHSSLGRLS